MSPRTCAQSRSRISLHSVTTTTASAPWTAASALSATVTPFNRSVASATESHAARDLRDVGADELADVRDLVDEADASAQIGVRRELHHLGRGDVGLHDLGVEALVERLDRVGVGPVEGADHDAIRVQEVAH